MTTHKAVQVASAGAPLTLVDVETTSPPPGHVRIAVAACGVCGTDHGFVSGGFPGLNWPLTPGHEIAGTVAELGDGVEGFAVGDRVAVGWFGGNCNHCVPCRKGQFMQCERMQVPSWHYPGGYAESVVAPATALARIPEGLTFAEAAPLGCAGVTTYNALRHTRAKPGDLVAVLGIGGLGHLGVQFARAMGFETVAIARGADKEADARALGAHHYIDSRAVDVASALRDLGGAAAVLATAANSQAMGDTVGGLAPEGQLVIVGVSADTLPISPMQLISQGLSVSGHPSGTSRDVEETMRFAVLTGVRARIEERPLAEAAEAYAAMEEGRARYRMVLTM
ncbi:Zn-dependent alcohol dehydrogenase [Mycolicibacterium phlei]|jgi:alcohol dehydrogenase|uniref:Alcohol dehydrogenase n=1 Tax=Mycolicibacterium phlei DSM 43239 = CCUG 21000 TaxID=1226750 RepID=A0A5N5VCL6_MYCPH|nr:alcohol dehydrogenase catalytic domain-containing protein [Mycolicibacterium phlei]VEG11551.1 Zn-dependent alcohol dehydrogenase [Mycobacteroides chelonae]AMO63457.1 Alcohol dehydrogenase [Mycolicibacterium phlei]KAB7759692.1 Zn-dependent alcohol dehydrogenase [Mycolicibacterium phlei DSM 43239 = CCUG 21000]KXW68737.1 Zn-dependent alcohol dehydrogenase [Mycolicibacterium phlei DSM 43239 = CCUG 21000]KXW69201.1 Zn-dependent alcohol dehydrogenase [Mycolicibacterium phlei DSM 43072]